jgi:hypothetical protein
LPLPDWVMKTWDDGRTTLERLYDLVNKFYQLLAADAMLTRLQGGMELYSNLTSTSESYITDFDCDILLAINR